MKIKSLDEVRDKHTKIDLDRALELKFGNVDIEKALAQTAQDIKDKKEKYLTHEEVFENARKIIVGSS